MAADICMMFRGTYDMVYCSPDGPVREALAERGVEFYPLRALSIEQVRRAIAKLRPDIVHAHDVSATCAAVCASGSIPVISHLHGNAENMRRLGVKSVLYALALTRVKSVIAVSESCIADFVLRRAIGQKGVYLRNVVYGPRVEALARRESRHYGFDFVYVGRISYPKDPARVARVASRVLQRCPESTLGVIGDGELRGDMIRVFREEEVEDRVTFTGWLPHPYAALAQAKCMLMCSRFEGTPISALEAMTLGVPIVSTPVDGMLQLVEDGVSGYLCNDDHGLSDRVVMILTNDGIRDRLARGARARVQTIASQQEYVANLTSIYSKVCPPTTH